MIFSSLRMKKMKANQEKVMTGEQLQLMWQKNQTNARKIWRTPIPLTPDPESLTSLFPFTFSITKQISCMFSSYKSYDRLITYS